MVKALETVQLQKSLDESAENLSGGRNRDWHWRGYFIEPEVYLLDEPTSALDEEAELTVMGRF